MKRIILLFVIVIMSAIAINAVKGHGNLKKYAGTYQGNYTKLISKDEKNEESFTLELKEDGTGVHYRNGQSFEVKWDIKNNEFTMTETIFGVNVATERQTSTGILIDYKGTLEDGKLDIFNGALDDVTTYEYVYEKK